MILLAFGLFAADLNGKWKGDMKTPNGDNLETTFVFKVDGEKLTGSQTNMYGEEQITEGTVKGDDVSFIVMAGGGQFKLVYKGKVVNGEIQMKVSIGDFGDSEFVAKKI